MIDGNSAIGVWLSLEEKRLVERLAVEGGVPTRYGRYSATLGRPVPSICARKS